jgi:DNA-directed RNA polymerase specialized sigma24 family protein
METKGMLQPPSEPSPPLPRRAVPPAARAGAHAAGELLRAWSAGDGAALDALIPVVYGELRRQARRALRHDAAGHTLQPTALVHEACLRLVDQWRARWEGRTRFFAVAESSFESSFDVEVLALDEALGRLTALDPTQARLVELRYFAGPSIPEAAAALGVSPVTVGREWTVTRLWLRRELGR